MDEKKRIIEFDAAESVPVDGQLPIDSASQGTKKITPALLLKAITDLLGDEALETLAQTLTGAVNEVKGIADDAQDLAENISDEYSSTSAYAKGDYCIHNNTLYKCTTAIGSGGETWNASHWSATKCDDELSELKQSLDNLYYYSTNSLTGDGTTNATTKQISITCPAGYTVKGVFCQWKDSTNIHSYADYLNVTTFNNTSFTVSTKWRAATTSNWYFEYTVIFAKS